MNKHDRPRLSKIKWQHLIIDEGHRIKNANCKLNTDLKHYSAKNRLLLTGTPIQVRGRAGFALSIFLQCASACSAFDLRRKS